MIWIKMVQSSLAPQTRIAYTLLVRRLFGCAGAFNVEVFVASGTGYVSKGLVSDPSLSVFWGEKIGQGTPVRVTFEGGQLLFVNSAGLNFTALAFGYRTKNWTSGLSTNYDIVAPAVTQAAKTPITDGTSLLYTFYESNLWTIQSAVIPGGPSQSVNELLATWTNPDGSTQGSTVVLGPLSLTITNSVDLYRNSFPANIQDQFQQARLVLRAA
jgi:hypothetical protein